MKTATAGRLKDVLTGALVLLSKYHDADETVSREDAEKLVESLKSLQHAVPEVSCWCVGYVYNPQKDFRPGEFAVFYGCETKKQAKEVYKAFKAKHNAKDPNGSWTKPEMREGMARVWQMVDPDADPKDVVAGVFNS